jgi:RNA polymerase sigma-70 factor, ECF subfamily
VVGTGDDLVSRVENLDEHIVVALVDLDQVFVARHDENVRCQGLPSQGFQRACGDRGSAECTRAREACRKPWHRPPGQDDRCHEMAADSASTRRRLRCLASAAYTQLMTGVEDQAAPAGMLPPQSDLPTPVADPASHLAAVYRDYPGLRALILRRVRDPEVAADILQDAAVTTLEKLRMGEIAHPENLGGYLYRVALNHLRNHRRKDRSALSSVEALDELPASENDVDWEDFAGRQWATAARRMLEEMPVARDREVLVRFYLDDEDREKICRELQLSEEHFNRVIFRARNRFRALGEHRGFRKADLLTIAAVGLCISSSGSGGLTAAGQATDMSNSSAVFAHTVILGDAK